MSGRRQGFPYQRVRQDLSDTYTNYAHQQVAEAHNKPDTLGSFFPAVKVTRMKEKEHELLGNFKEIARRGRYTREKQREETIEDLKMLFGTFLAALVFMYLLFTFLYWYMDITPWERLPPDQKHKKPMCPSNCLPPRGFCDATGKCVCKKGYFGKACDRHDGRRSSVSQEEARRMREERLREEEKKKRASGSGTGNGGAP